MTDTPSRVVIEALIARLKLHAYELVNGGANASQLRADLFEAAALLGRGEEPTAIIQQLREAYGRQRQSAEAVTTLAGMSELDIAFYKGKAAGILQATESLNFFEGRGAGAQEPPVCKTCQGSGFVAYMTHASGAEGEGCPDCEPTEIGAPGDGQYERIDRDRGSDRIGRSPVPLQIGDGQAPARALDKLRAAFDAHLISEVKQFGGIPEYRGPTARTLQTLKEAVAEFLAVAALGGSAALPAKQEPVFNLAGFIKDARDINTMSWVLRIEAMRAAPVLPASQEPK